MKLSKRDKFKVFLRYTYSPYTFAGAGFNAGLAQATGGWHSYGGGMEGYGKRYGAALADAESGASFGAFLFPVLFNQDPRYLRSSSRKFSKHEPKRLQKLEQSPRVEKIEQMMLGPVALLPCGRETTREDWKQLVG